MNRQQRRKAAKTPIDAATLKRIVDDAVETTKQASLSLFMLAIADDYKNHEMAPQETLKYLEHIKESINELQRNEARRDEIVAYLKTGEEV